MHTQEDITVIFSYPAMYPTNVNLSYKVITSLNEKLTSNLAAFPTTLGGGAHGNSSLILSDPKYFWETYTRFEVLAFPETVATIPIGTTVAQELHLRKIRQTALEEWHLVNICEKDI